MFISQVTYVIYLMFTFFPKQAKLKHSSAGLWA